MLNNSVCTVPGKNRWFGWPSIRLGLGRNAVRSIVVLMFLLASMTHAQAASQDRPAFMIGGVLVKLLDKDKTEMQRLPEARIEISRRLIQYGDVLVPELTEAAWACDVVSCLSSQAILYRQNAYVLVGLATETGSPASSDAAPDVRDYEFEVGGATPPAEDHKSRPVGKDGKCQHCTRQGLAEKMADLAQELMKEFGLRPLAELPPCRIPRFYRGLLMGGAGGIGVAGLAMGAGAVRHSQADQTWSLSNESTQVRLNPSSIDGLSQGGFAMFGLGLGGLLAGLIGNHFTDRCQDRAPFEKWGIARGAIAGALAVSLVASTVSAAAFGKLDSGDTRCVPNDPEIRCNFKEYWGGSAGVAAGSFVGLVVTLAIQSKF